MVGERLLDLCKDAGLTQNDLSAIIHVNKQSISSYERDQSEPPDEIKIRIAKIKYIDANTSKEVTTTQREKTDLDAQIGKTDFNVRPNGGECHLQKLTTKSIYLINTNLL